MNTKQKLVTISLVVLLLSLGSFYGVKAMGLTTPITTNTQPVSEKVTGDRLTAREFNRILSLLKNIFVSTTTNDVGIGGEPDGRLTIKTGGENRGITGVNTDGEGYLVLDNENPAARNRLRIDPNELQASRDGGAGQFDINRFGGDIGLASGATSTGSVFMGRGNAVMVGSDGKVRSDQYCDRNGNNCTKISDLSRINVGCEDGKVLKGFNASGNPICRNETAVTKDGMKGVTCADGQVLKGFRADNGNPICRNETAVTKDGMKNVGCADGQVLKGFRADNGNPICRNETAVTKDGMKGVNCSAGEVLRGFDNNGNVLCEKLFTRCRNDGKTSAGADSNACAWARNNVGKGSARYRAINCEVVGYQVVQLASNLWYSGGKWQTQVSNTFPIDCTDGTILVVDSQ